MDKSVYDKVIAFIDLGKDVFPREIPMDSQLLTQYGKRLREAYGECIVEMRRTLNIEKADIDLAK